MMRQITILVVALALAAHGCTAITDFEDADSGTDTGTETSVDPYKLSENVSDPVQVSLLTNGNASLTFELEEELPQAEQGDYKLADDLLGSAVQLIVMNTAGNITANLKDGDRIDADPSDPGQYTIGVDDDRDKIVIVFFNETKDNLSLQSDGMYKAEINIQPNSYFFIETFERNVKIMN
ncbi:MAG: hypothetical protein GY847_17370 [Proteobacteria bacterium]|nr:hypothetical protein [Pseudomonadota bacterium]